MLIHILMLMPFHSSEAFKLNLQTTRYICSGKAYNSIKASHARKRYNDIMEESRLTFEWYQEAIDNDCFSKCVFIKRFMGEKTTMGKHTAWLFWANKTNFIIVIFYNSLLSLEGRWNETRVATRFILYVKIFMQSLLIR